MFNLIKKITTKFKNMFTEDSLATAQIAKIFGSELMKVQESARTDSGSQPQILAMHPKQFLGVSSQMQAKRKQEEEQMLRVLQQEAESAHPLPQQEIPRQPNVQTAVREQNASQPGAVQPPPVQTVTRSTAIQQADSPVWERINFNLERIANRLEQVDLTVKRKRVKRTAK